jgi:hypothetical protein
MSSSNLKQEGDNKAMEQKNGQRDDRVLGDDIIRYLLVQLKVLYEVPAIAYCTFATHTLDSWQGYVAYTILEDMSYDMIELSLSLSGVGPVKGTY